MNRSQLPGWNKKRLRIALLLFFLALATPTAVLIKQAYSQLKWEAFHRHRLMAEELVTRIDRRYIELIEIEGARAFTDYAFLNVAGDPAANFLQRSPLSAYPVQSTLPGVIGYFQIDNQGQFSTPLLPETDGASQTSQTYGLTDSELTTRQQARDQIYQLLSDNKLVGDPTPVMSSAIRQKQRSSTIKRTDGLSNRQNLDAISSAQLSLNDEYDTSQAYNQQAASEVAAAQSGFDKLQKKMDLSSTQQASSPALGRIEDLKLEKRYQQKLSEAEKDTRYRSKKNQEQKFKRALRKEKNILPAQAPKVALAEEALAEHSRKTTGSDARVSMFESEIDAFEFSVLDSGHFVLYRKVWREGQRYIQGLLIEPNQFIDKLIASAFYATTASQASNLTVAYHGNVLSVLSKKNAHRSFSSTKNLQGNLDLQGTLLLQDRLSPPLGNMELIFSINKLPAGPGATVTTWLSLILLMVLCGGFLLMYRLGVGQITLARQQQDFVSAISHELKTPLTSIRMYGEMLREGWAPEEKRLSYYNFIYDESERLTRLINNVLQLAHLTRNDLHTELMPCRVAQLMDTVRSKISSQIEHAGFQLNIKCEADTPEKSMLVDTDYFIQIVINLVDNAIKFSKNSTVQKIDISCTPIGDNKLQFSVRDYGPGIPKDQMRKIFHLFYRSENELTRETVGTGIGLALVHQLVQAMKGQIDVINQIPGTEFRIIFPVLTTRSNAGKMKV